MKWEGRLGVPYKGSKNAIAREIIGILPSGKRFVDLFAGGCAMTHAAMLSGKYDSFLANDMHGFGVRLFCDAIAGKYVGAWRNWVSREEFMERKSIDPMIAICWSFSNNCRHYMYGRLIEEHKRNLHNEYLKSGILTEEIESIERLRSLERLSMLERFCSRIAQSFNSYESYEHKDGDVVYCDPPYANTSGYVSGAFDNAAFWEWVRTRDYPVFVSEYSAPEGFTPIWQKGKCKLMHVNGGAGKVAEYVFVARQFAPQFQTDLFLGV